MWSNMARPQSTCMGFGRSDFMRVPSPAAMTTAHSGRRALMAFSSNA
jgi:hypothetical protein